MPLFDLVHVLITCCIDIERDRAKHICREFLLLLETKTKALLAKRALKKIVVNPLSYSEP